MTLTSDNRDEHGTKTKLDEKLKSFMSEIESTNFRGALAGIMGQNPIGIERARALLPLFSQLDALQQESLLDWCKAPMPRQRISEFDQRWYVEKLARHEMAHIVAAKALGFQTGDVTLVLNSPDGDHMGTSAVFLETNTPSLEEVVRYLQCRIAVLLAGSIAEAESVDELRRNADSQVHSLGAASDLQKATELITLLLNIQGKLEVDALDRALDQQTLWTVQIVAANYDVIQALAMRLADRIEFYGQRVGSRGSEIDAEPEISQIVQFTGLNEISNG
jgi:hypothetical protein